MIGHLFFREEVVIITIQTPGIGIRRPVILGIGIGDHCKRLAVDPLRLVISIDSGKAGSLILRNSVTILIQIDLLYFLGSRINRKPIARFFGTEGNFTLQIEIGTEGGFALHVEFRPEGGFVPPVYIGISI